MNTTFIKKYKPKTLEDFFLKEEYINLINMFINTNQLTLLICGNKGTGKTTLINIITNIYYNNKIDKNYIFYVNNLQEKGINYYRDEIKTFCNNFNKKKDIKKTIIIDDIDLLNEKKQQIFRHFLDNYNDKINYLFTCNNLQNVIECIQTRLNIISLPNISKQHLKIIYNKIVKNENIEIAQKAKKNIFKIVNNSINQLINYMEKFKLINEKITNIKLKHICTNLSYFHFKEYTKNWYVNKNFKDSIKILNKIYNTGYSIIDIFEFYFIFVKDTNIIKNEDKFKIIKIISKYITIFYKLHEKQIELYFFTNDLIQNIT